MSSNVQALITAAAQSGGVDPTLALAVAQRESSLNPNAVGTKGERGVFQIMPSTAAGLGIDPSNLEQNIAGGTAILSHNLATFGGDQAKALAAYNCGVACVQNAVARGGDANWYSYIPASTYAYVVSILGSLPPQTIPAADAGGETTPAPSDASGTIADPMYTPPAPSSPSTGTLVALVGAGLLAAALALG